MKTVHAYRDNGWMSRLTRWKPRRVYCTDDANHRDEPGVEHVVKFRELAARSRRIGDILNISQWENFRDDIQGGHLL